ncbi:hypothetical protein [Pseudomonas delhiensis]|uniref:hypothetical protein n=1 Tax=Pseudomonas delhiensis TaxID=366289 RepID=UPI001113B47B|nr:hypothetical protein [Pseudomonas delhiensis]
MRLPLFLLTLLVTTASFAEESSKITELKAKCAKEASSMFRANNGTPSCDRLDRALREDKQKKGATSYQWNGSAGKYCYYNDAGEVVSCP